MKFNDGQHRSKRRSRCPHCGFLFKILAVSGGEIPDLAPVICEDCGEISLLQDGVIRKVTASELEVIKQSPAYLEVLKPVEDLVAEIKRKKRGVYE